MSKRTDKNFKLRAKNHDRTEQILTGAVFSYPFAQRQRGNPANELKDHESANENSILPPPRAEEF